MVDNDDFSLDRDNLCQGRSGVCRPVLETGEELSANAIRLPLPSDDELVGVANRTGFCIVFKGVSEVEIFRGSLSADSEESVPSLMVRTWLYVLVLCGGPKR